jgi:putative ABC transport system permease protein
MAFGVAVTGCTVLLSGLAPALRARREDVNGAMKDGGTTSTGRRDRTYKTLAIAQVALALMTLMWSGLLIRAAIKTAADRPGFLGYDAEHLMFSYVRPSPADSCNGEAEARTFMSNLAARAAVVPGVRYADVEIGVRAAHSVATSDMPGAVVYQRVVSSVLYATPDIFRTWAIPVVQGRDFEPGDMNSGGVVIVNDTTAKRFWPHVSPVGRLIKLGPKQMDLPWLRVIGVTRAGMDTVGDKVIDPAAEITVVGLGACGGLSVLARSSGTGPQVPVGLYHALRAAVPNGQVGSVNWALNRFHTDLAARTTIAAIFTVFGLFGLALAAFGIYGVLSYTVSLRMREFAMRVALGATSPDLRRMVWRDAMIIVLAGTGIGAWVAMWGGHLLKYTVGDVGIWYTDAFALVGAEALLISVALAACTGPVLTAMRANPVDLLRST